MIHSTSRVFAAALGLTLAGGLAAQAKVGEAAPEVEFGKVWNDGPASWDELDGKVVLLEFSETW